MKERTLEAQLYRIGWILLAALGATAVVYFRLDAAGLTLPCTLYTFFGFYCPGCGGTRAVHALVHGHFLKSLWYHPLVPYGAVLTVSFLGSHLLERLHVPGVRGMKFREWYLWAALGIVLGNWLLKNVLLHLFRIAL